MPVRLDIECLSVGSCRHPERMVRRDGRWRTVEFPSVATLIKHPSRGAVLLDTGYADHFHHATEPFPERLYRWMTPPSLPAEQRLEVQLTARGISPQDIHTCIVSHVHADHVAGLADLPNARIIMSRTEYHWLLASTRLRGLLHGVLPALLPADLEQRLDFVEDATVSTTGDVPAALGPARDLFGDGSLLAIALPGHTPGQIGLFLVDEHDRRVLLCADSAWTEAAYRQGVMPSRLTSLIQAHSSAYYQTLQALTQVVTDHPEIVILPTHCASSLARYNDSPR